MEKSNKMYQKYKLLLEKKSEAEGRTLTTADMCRATGISENVISNWNNRGGSLSAKNLLLVAEYLGVSPTCFFEAENEND